MSLNQDCREALSFQMRSSVYQYVDFNMHTMKNQCCLFFVLVLSFVAYGLALFSFYVLMPYAIKETSATAINLNLLSADFYALFAGLFLFHYQV